VIAEVPSASEELVLGIPGFAYADLYDPAGLRRLAEAFHAQVAGDDHELWAEWQRYRDGAELSPPQVSDLLIRMARHLSRFLMRLFQIEDATGPLRRDAEAAAAIHRFKREFVMRRAIRKHPNADGVELEALAGAMNDLCGDGREDPELARANAILALLDEEAGWAKGSVPPELAQKLDTCERWVAAAARARRQRGEFRDWACLDVPEDMDFPDNLVELVRPDPAQPRLIEGPERKLRRRDGFGLTDRRWGARQALDHAYYCVICHEREKDSCTRGYPLPRKDEGVARNPLGVPLNGCPLDERISEAHLLKREGDAVAALAMVVLDNPMCPGTGHRICNDCMKACIYQKQQPVNIPQIETHTLSDVLKLPWGVEIYGLLTRWNPLNVKRPYALPYNGLNVLVDGMGPAGYTLAQWLLNEGFGVVGVDGLKIEPLPPHLLWDGDRPPQPVRDFSEIEDALDERVSAGFGGVAEYGITVRWDKNFLKLIYLTLMRRRTFRVYGGVRLGGTLTLNDAWQLGFHHVAIAAGAGRPTLLDIKNNLIPGIRAASDFLMALQLTGAFKKASIVNLMLRLPAIVIGGGLTAIDTSTEALAYYPVQVEKMLDSFEAASAALGEDRVWNSMLPEEQEILREMLDHGRTIRAERRRAKDAGEEPAFLPLLQSWGGVTLCYRRRIQDAPAYRINHEEVAAFLEEGVRILENVEPVEAVPDQWGRLAQVRLTATDTGEEITLPCRSMLVAAGTNPNIVYEKEHPGTFQLDGRKRFFQPHRREDGRLVPAAGTLQDPGFFTSYSQHGRYVTFFGDNHPAYAGSVVKAHASSKRGYGEIVGLFRDELSRLDEKDQPRRDDAWQTLGRRLDDQLIARVDRVIRLTPTIVEVIVHAPQHTRRFEPGQFYRLQNYEVLSPVVDGRRLQMEGVALTGAWVDKERGLLSLIALELGVSSRLCAMLKPGEPVIVMGPTGAPSEIRTGENVLLAGGGLGNAVLFSIAKAMRDRGNRVLYFAAYKSLADLFHQDDIEAACDQVIWSVDAGELIQPRRPQDRTFLGNVVQAMIAYDDGQLGEQVFPLKAVDRVMAIGSDRMMAAVTRARHEALKDRLNPHHVAIASINSPMQCMMKEVCAQCLQKHVDPATGNETVVFSCFNQDQLMDEVDWQNLNDRLCQNTVAEKLMNLWLDSVLDNVPLAV